MLKKVQDGAKKETAEGMQKEDGAEDEPEQSIEERVDAQPKVEEAKKEEAEEDPEESMQKFLFTKNNFTGNFLQTVYKQGKHYAPWNYDVLDSKQAIRENSKYVYPFH